jgi:hypothetical protein
MIHHMDEMLLEESIVYDEPTNYGACAKREREPDNLPTEPTCKTDQTRLEPIENAGGIRLHLMSKHNKQYTTQALALLRGDFLEEQKGGARPIQRLARIKSEELCDNDVATLTQRGQIKQFMVIFTRPKRNGYHRLIGHPKELNERYPARTVRLCTLTTLIGHLNMILDDSPKTEDKGSIFFIELDFKNYFPQIPIGKRLQEHMGIASKSKRGELVFLLQKVLTQGWNNSTFVAQSLTWTSITYVPPDEDTLGLEEHDEETPPPYLLVRHALGSGIITVIYDNILMAFNNEQLKEKWSSRLRGNLQRFNIVTKYINDTTDDCTFCGIDFKVVPISNTMKWRTTTNTFEAWKQRTITNRTAKEGLSIIGVILRQVYVRGDNFINNSPILRIARRISSDMSISHHAEWNKKDYLTPEACISILSALGNLDNDWRTRERMISPPKYVLVCDATPTATCHLIFNSEGTQLGNPVCGKMSITEISTAEALAVSKAIQSLPPVTTPEYIIIITDNTTVGRSLAKGYSTSEDVDKIVETIYQDARARNFNIATIGDIKSEENLADIGTRSCDWDGEDANIRRVKTIVRIKDCVNLYFQGTRWVGRR